MPDDFEKYIAHTGPSMNPTLKAGDRPLVIPYNGKKIRRGDVIVFLSPEDGRRISHRIVSIYSPRIKTRGDNNNQVDPWILNHDNILGRVVFAQRENRKRRVFGGTLGHLLALAVRAIHMIDSRVSFLLHPLYHRLARTSVIRRLLPGRMKPRVLCFNRSAGSELQLLMGHRVIGRWLPGKAQWQIRRPFRLFVDEESLPENPSKPKPLTVKKWVSP